VPAARRITPEASELEHKATCWIRSREVRDVVVIGGRGGGGNSLQITGLKVKTDNAPKITLTQAAIPVPNLHSFSSETLRNIITTLWQNLSRFFLLYLLHVTRFASVSPATNGHRLQHIAI
jgi:hypothetical protein